MYALTVDQSDVVSGASSSGALVGTIVTGQLIGLLGGILASISTTIVSRPVQVDSFIVGFLSTFQKID